MSKRLYNGFGFGHGYSSFCDYSEGFGDGCYFIDDYSNNIYNFDSFEFRNHFTLHQFIWDEYEDNEDYPYSMIIKESHYKHD